MFYRQTLFLLFFCFAPLLAMANDLPVQETQIIPEEGDNRFFQEFLNMLTTLGLIVGTILLLSWFLKKMVHSRIQQVNTTSIIKIVERRSLSPKSALYLVEIFDKQILVGETPNGLTTLAQVSLEPDERTV